MYYSYTVQNCELSAKLKKFDTLQKSSVSCKESIFFKMFQSNVMKNILLKAYKLQKVLPKIVISIEDSASYRPQHGKTFRRSLL